MPKKLQSDDDDLMKIFEGYAELRREQPEYEDTVHTTLTVGVALMCSGQRAEPS
jgi:hypothetical protein